MPAAFGQAVSWFKVQGYMLKTVFSYLISQISYLNTLSFILDLSTFRMPAALANEAAFGIDQSLWVAALRTFFVGCF